MMMTTATDMLKNIASKLPTLVLVLVAVVVAYVMYQRWIDKPWTRDGQVRADIVKIAPRVSGYIVEVAVKDNQRVRKGELLFRIDPSSYQLSVDTAQVQLEQAREDVAALAAAVVAAEAQVAEARASVTSAEGGIAEAQFGIQSAAAAIEEAQAAEAAALAMIKQAEAALEETQKESDRAQRLLKDRAGSLESAQQKAAAVAVSQASLDGARANWRQSRSKVGQARAGRGETEAQLTIAQNALTEITAALATANANLVQAKATLGEPGDANVRVREAMVGLEEARLKLSWTSMYAPFDGYVTNLDVNEGAFGFPGIPIAAFVDGSSFRVDGYFQETKLRHIRPGDRAIITLMSHPDIELNGVVDSFGYAINPPGVADTEGVSNLVPQIEPTFDWVRLPQRVPVRIRLEDVPEDIQLVSGMTASVAIRPSRQD
jgi:multidrug resistance efflux pump